MSEFVSLCEHVAIKKGKAPLEADYSGAGAEPYLSPEYLRGNSGVGMAKPATDAVRAQVGDTILLWDGSNAGEFFPAKKGVIASTMARLRPNQTFRQEYFFHVLKHAEPRLKSQTNGTGIPHVDREVLETLRLLCLPNKEQKLAAEILDTLDTAIHETEALIAKLKAVKQGLLHDLLTRGIAANGQLRPPQTEAPELYKPSPLGWIPKEWDDSTLGAKTQWASGGTPSKALPSNWVGPVPLLTPKDMKSFEMSDTSEHISERAADLGSRVMPAETIFIVVRGMILAHSFPVVLSCRKMAFNQDIKAVTSGPSLNARFLAHWFVANSNNFLRKVTEATHGTKKLDMDDLVNMRIGVPDLSEQSAIVQRQEATDNQISDESLYLEQLRALKAGLMDDLLTGRVRVTPLLTHPEPTHA